MTTMVKYLTILGGKSSERELCGGNCLYVEHVPMHTGVAFKVKGKNGGCFFLFFFFFFFGTVFKTVCLPVF